MQALTREGSVCHRCGGTKRYASNGKCVNCQKFATAKIKHKFLRRENKKLKKKIRKLLNQFDEFKELYVPKLERQSQKMSEVRYDDF
jgi:predicted ATP-dependent serine protease